MFTFASDVPGLCRCYRCGGLLYNPDDTQPPADPPLIVVQDRRGFEKAIVEDRIYVVSMLTIDRIIPGCHGGTYRRNNIRPACGPCNSETGGGLWARKRSTTSSNSRSTTAGA